MYIRETNMKHSKHVFTTHTALAIAISGLELCIARSANPVFSVGDPFWAASRQKEITSWAAVKVEGTQVMMIKLQD